MEGLKAQIQESSCTGIVIFQIIDLNSSSMAPVVSSSMESKVAEYLTRLVTEDQRKITRKGRRK